MWHQSLLNERNLTNNDHIVCVSREKRRQVIKQNLFYLHSNVLITSRFWENGWKNSKKINVLMFQCCDLFIFFLTSTKVHFYVLKKKPTLNFRQDPERAIGIPNQCLPGYFLFFFFFSQSFYGTINANLLSCTLGTARCDSSTTKGFCVLQESGYSTLLTENAL